MNAMNPSADLSRRRFLQAGGLAVGSFLAGSHSLNALTLPVHSFEDELKQGRLGKEGLLLELQRHLQVAIEIEHTTIPPYLTALYSIAEGTNQFCVDIIRGIVVEEMLHLTLACNVLNAVGGSPKLSYPNFIPRYPLTLGFDGRAPIQVGLNPLSLETLEAFLWIEEPGSLLRASEAESLERVEKSRGRGFDHLDIDGRTIGEFYRDVSDLIHLAAEEIPDLFSGDPGRQVDSEYYYNGGGQILVVDDLDSADRAISLITDQGEGTPGTIYDSDAEYFDQPQGIAHYFAFNQIYLGQRYQAGDLPGDAPSGDLIDIDWDAIYPILPDARFSDYSNLPDLRRGVRRFYRTYKRLLADLQIAFNGRPERLIHAVTLMYEVKYSLLEVVKNPMLGTSNETHAGPVFP